jgi:hypothetical protein
MQRYHAAITKKSGLSAAPVDPISAPEIPGGAETA